MSERDVTRDRAANRSRTLGILAESTALGLTAIGVNHADDRIADCHVVIVALARELGGFIRAIGQEVGTKSVA